MLYVLSENKSISFLCVIKTIQSSNKNFLRSQSDVMARPKRFFQKEAAKFKVYRIPFEKIF